MANPNVLTAGSLEQILEQNTPNLSPLVQILGTRIMTNNRIRAVISDSATLCQHCLIMNADPDGVLLGQLPKFTVVRLDEYSTSMLAKKENTPIILVTKLTVITSGEDITHKLDVGEAFQSAEITNAAPTVAVSQAGNQFAQASSSRPVAVVTGTLNSENIAPINVLTPFFNAWVIRVRVMNKTPMKEYNNARGSGKLFSFDVCDETGEIRITAFNAEADKFFDFIERDKVYLISRGSIKSANKRFSPLTNDYEISLNSYTVIELVPGGESIIPMPEMRYKFINLTDLVGIAARTSVDVIGVIRSISSPETLVSRRTQKELIKREVAIVDQSLTEVRLTMWNEAATNFAGVVGQVIVLKAAMVDEFRGNKNLSTGQSTIIQLEPDIAETLVIRNWYCTQGSKATFSSLTVNSEDNQQQQQQRFACQITPKLVAANTTGQLYSNLSGIIAAVNRPNNQLYKACGNNGCMKKVTEENPGQYKCIKCDRTSDTFMWRILISANVADATGSIWVTLFQEQAEKLLGRSVEELAQLYESDQAEYAKAINEVRFKSFSFRTGSRIDEYQNDHRVKTTVYKATPNECLERSRRLMKMIDVLGGQVPV